MRAGYRSVRAFPLRRRDVFFGGLNVFGGELTLPPEDDELALGQAFADLVTVILLAPPVPRDHVQERRHEPRSLPRRRAGGPE